MVGAHDQLVSRTSCPARERAWVLDQIPLWETVSGGAQWGPANPTGHLTRDWASQMAVIYEGPRH